MPNVPKCNDWPGELVGANEWVTMTKCTLVIRQIIVDPKKQS